MFIFSYSAAVVAIICFVMAAAIFIKKRDRLSLCLVIYTSGVGLWNLSNAFADLSWNELTARLWCGLALIGSMIFIVFYVVFLEHFLAQRAFKNRLVAFFILLPALFFSIVSFTRLYITDIIIVGITPTITVPGRINYFILAYSLTVIFYGLWRLQTSYQLLAPIKRQQILYIKAGFLVSLGAGIIFTIILPLLGNFMLFSLAAQFTIVAVFLTVYTIYKHNFLDIKIVIQRGLIFSILFICIVSFYLGVLLMVQSTLFGTSEAAHLISGILTCVVGIFSVPKIDALLRHLTDRIFFKEKYDAADVIKDLSEIISASLDLNGLAGNITTILKKKLKIKFVYIEFFSVSPSQVSDKLRLLESQYSPKLVLCLERNGAVVGAMVFGPKLSGDDYAEEDINLFKTLAHQLTLALERYQLYEQVKDYSKNLEKKIEERTMELKTLQEKQSQELFDIAHELQTPLTIMKGEINNLIKNSPAIKDCPQKEKVEHLEKNVDRVSNFINSLLKLARMDFMDKQNMEPVNISDLLLELVEEFAVIAEESKVTFYHHIERGIFVCGDKNKLTELVNNLVSNAMKYIANNREVTVKLEKTGQMVRLAVIDTGVGIPAEDLPHLFERFYRGKQEQGSGTGLGLAICKKIVTLHNGEINIKSQVGVGTSVEVLVPLFKL